ncbi:hypothetical protein F0342_07055 [Bacillus sp. CH30_1T]|uniref:hypothetical protein n=1 Tax=Bacillus sp. CH30_1T TaxID=2604836 RepID=UPI0011EE69E6|nr:hypothetical protein [Bacillus sp. CH30_1T]KAA0565359.1 hypothetical protein F0342_07055 [Bacillus sp. CH30_1T]
MKKIVVSILTFGLIFSGLLGGSASASNTIGTRAIEGPPSGGSACEYATYVPHSQLVDFLNAYDNGSSGKSLAGIFTQVAGDAALEIADLFIGPIISTLRSYAYDGKSLYVCTEVNPNYNGYNTYHITRYYGVG